MAHTGNIPWNKGKTLTESHRKHLSEAHKGLTSGMKGKRHSAEVRAKMSKSKRGENNGENHYNWKGGISVIDRRIRHLPDYKEWRNAIFKRDSWTCRVCSVNGVYVTAHHIKSFSKIIKENNIIDILSARQCVELWNLDNGVTLCEDCHKLTDNYAGRKAG